MVGVAFNALYHRKEDSLNFSLMAKLSLTTDSSVEKGQLKSKQGSFTEYGEQLVASLVNTFSAYCFLHE